MWRVAVNILSKKLWIADRGWFSSLGVGQGTNNNSPIRNQFVTESYV